MSEATTTAVPDRQASDPTAVVEDYVKAIFALESRGDEAVATTALAERLGVTPGSASAMVKKLADRGLVSHVRYRGVRLTPEGARLALEVVRHHRLLELYLAEELGMAWDRVHEEAEILEHVISEELEELIAAKLGHPTRDPHGDPIPTSDLRLEDDDMASLGALEPGAAGTFVRVSDSDPAMLRYLADRGISPGDRFEILERQPFGGPIEVRIGERAHTLGGALVEAMRVECAGPGGTAGRREDLA